MVIHKRKKVTKYRAHTTHGGGHRKKRRGAGSRGGRGNAGTGKRAGQRVAGGRVITGKKGFLPRRTKKSIKAINLNYFTSNKLNQLVSAGKITKEGDVYSLDLNKLGYQKLLGTGKLNLKLKLKVSSYSAQAEEKVKKAGGEIITTETETEVKKEVVAEEPAKESTEKASLDENNQ